jgi:hypothetical protein
MSLSSFSNSDDSTSSSNNEDILEDMDQDDLVIFQMMATMASNTNDLFNSYKMEELGGINMWTQLLVFGMFWVQCEPHRHYSKL